MNKYHFIIISALVFIFGGCGAAYAHLTVDETVFTVTKSERVVTGSGDSLSSKYLLFSETEVLQNSDSLWHLKFNSSDLYARMKEGKTYKAKVYGWRVEFFSMYRNIVKVEEVK